MDKAIEDGGGDGYGSSDEGRKDREERMDKLRAELGEEGYAKRNDWIKDLLPALLPLGWVPKAVDYVQGFLKEQEYKDVMAKEAEKNEAARVKAESDNLLSMIKDTNETIPYSPPAGDPSEQAKTLDRILNTDFSGMDRGSIPQVRPSDMGARVLFKQNDPYTNTWGGGINASEGTRTALNPFPGIVDRAIDTGTQNVGTYTPVQGAYIPGLDLSATDDGVTVGDVRQNVVNPTSTLSEASNLNMTPLQKEVEARLQESIRVSDEREAINAVTASDNIARAQAEARAEAVNSSNAAADRAYGNAPEGRTGRDATAGDGYGGGYGAVAAGYTGGSEAAQGGLSTPYGFQRMAQGGIANLHQYNLGSYSDGGRLLKGPGDGVSDSIPATIGQGQPARLANNEFVIPARIVSEIGNGSTDAGARKLYAMMDRIQKRRAKTVGKNKIAVNSGAYKEVDRL